MPAFAEPAVSAVPVLAEDAVRDWVAANVPAAEYRDKRVLLVIPDATRTAPLPLLFSALADHLGGVVAGLDLIVALGTHQPMSEAAILKMIGVGPTTSLPRNDR